MRLALAMVVLLSACTSEDSGFPAVEESFRVEGAAYVCDGPAYQGCDSDVSCECIWENVTVAGAPACWARVLFARPDAASPWTVARISRSSAACD